MQYTKRTQITYIYR